MSEKRTSQHHVDLFFMLRKQPPKQLFMEEAAGKMVRIVHNCATLLAACGG